MAKKVIALVLVLIIAAAAGISVYAAGFTDAQLRTANALNHLGLFLGTDIGYQLERELNRLEGIVLTVRLFGSEDEALSKAYAHPYTDIPIWKDNQANKYVGYANKAGITKGISPTEFGPSNIMTDYMFITFTLRALGYRDSGSNAQFEWNDPYELAVRVGLISSKTPDTKFTRGDAVSVFWNALTIDDYALARSLAARGVFTENELNESIEIYKYGKIVSGTTSDTTGGNSGHEPPAHGGDTDNTGSAGTRPGKDTTAAKDTTAVKDTTAAKDTTGSKDTTNNSGSTGSDTTSQSPKAITYEEYEAMSAEEQQAYYLSYSDPMDFFAWYNDAKAEYDAQNPGIEIGPGGSVDIGDFFG